MRKVMAFWAACNVAIFWEHPAIAVLNAGACGLLLGLDAPGGEG